LAFDDLREKLLLGGIAPRHVRRYLKELNEHLEDLTREQREAGYGGEDAALRARARLGSDEELASAMLAQKGFRSIAARAPWAVFLFLPPVAAAAIGILFIGSLVLIGKQIGFPESMTASLAPQWFQILANSLVLCANLAVMPLTAVLFVAIAHRQRLPLFWPLAATVLLLVFVLHSDVLFAPRGKGHLQIGAGILFARHTWSMLVDNWRVATVQYVLTVLPMLWLYKARRRVA
jgi:hypothetical protein